MSTQGEAKQGWWAQATAEGKAEAERKFAAKQEAKALRKYNCDAGKKLVLKDGVLHLDGREVPLQGVTLTLESAAAARERMTATRVVAGAVVLGPLGAILGGMSKKDESRMFVVAGLPDGSTVTAEARAKDEGKVRQFVERVNVAAREVAGIAGS